MAEHSKADQVLQSAAARWPAAKEVFDSLRNCARDAGLRETFGTHCIELAHRPSDSVVMRLRANGYIEIPFDSMSRNRGLKDNAFHRSVIHELRAAGFVVRDDQAHSWPQLPAVDIDSPSKIRALESLIIRMASRANSVKS